MTDEVSVMASEALASAEAQPASPQHNLGELTAKYVKLRDLIAAKTKEFDEQLAPYKNLKNQLDAIFAGELGRTGAMSMRTEGGTISLTKRRSATLEDPLAFRTFVQNMGEWDLADIRANAEAVETYAETNKQLPPGVKFSAIFTVSVRRPSQS